jgi:hypothetical protein
MFEISVEPCGSPKMTYIGAAFTMSIHDYHEGLSYAKSKACRAAVLVSVPSYHCSSSAGTGGTMFCRCVEQLRATQLHSVNSVNIAQNRPEPQVRQRSRNCSIAQTSHHIEYCKIATPYIRNDFISLKGFRSSIKGNALGASQVFGCRIM